MAINNTSGAAPSSTLGTLMGVMNTAKEKWDSSGANDAMNRVAASVPQGTKDYLSATTGELFNRQRLRSVTVCFGIGEERPFYVEKSPALLIARVKHNFTFFYLNYLILTALLFCLTLLISPSAIIGIGLLGALWVYVIQQTQKGTLVIAGKSISQSQATTGLVVFSAFALFFLLRGVFWYALCSSGFLVLVHAGLRDASMHQDGDDHVDMVGEVPGETASFLNDNSGVTTKSTYHRNRNIHLSTLFWVLEPSTEPAKSHKMSLEAKFASLTIDDASSVVNTVKSEGVEKSGLAANISVLSAKCASEDEAEALSALATVKALAQGVPEAQVFTKECFGACLENATHKSVSVQKASKEAAFAIVDNVQPFAMKSLLPTIFAELPVEKKWNVREVALECIARFSKNAPRQLGDALPLIVPEVTACMWDTKKQVKVAATNAMKSSLDVIGNRDIEHMTGKILTAITTPKEVPEIMHQMAGVTFVQSVESAALAMVVPLLLRGLREKTTATKRQAAVIIDNMSKLVDNPLDAAPFLPLLLPALETNAESIADPEAREVTQRAVAQLNRLKGLAEKQASVRGDVSKLGGEFKKALKAEDATGGKQAVIEYACVIASCLMDLKFMEDLQWEKNLSTILGSYFKEDVKTAIESVRSEAEKLLEIPEEDDEEDDAEELCNCQFTLAYGTKILLHNTKMKLLRGRRYGLLGPNDCGKTTLMRAIANNQVEGFPDVTQVRTVFVEADIQGEQSHLSCVDYVAADEKLQAMGVDKDKIREILGTVGFTPDGKAKPDHAVSTLSGGWRMKLALARAMLQQADILLLDEPTNHLDVINVAWVKTYLNSLSNVTSIIVSHDSGLLNDCCTNMMSFDNLKLRTFKGNLDEYVKVHPAARAYFSLTASKMKFKFPQPGPIEGVKSKGKALMKMQKCTFTYPKNDKPTLYDISVQVSLSSRVACIGENGAGKSTMIKLLVGEIEPQEGDVWKHPNARIAYVAQHAFHHIEQHLSKTPNEYIRWRFANGGEDKESLVKVTMQFTDEELALQKKPFELQIVDEASGKIQKVKKVVAELVGGRKLNKSKEYEYEVKYAGSTTDSGEYLSAKVLKKMGWEKACKAVDLKLAQLAGMYVRPLSTKNVEEHLEGCGLAREFGTHYRMSALSGGQKVKVVLAAAMWMQPHIVILDEPTNYLDRESLGALAGAIEEFDGGIIIISHNNEFVSKLCPETWVMDAGHLETKGDADWMLKQDTKIEDQQQLQEMTDAAGNKVEVKQAKKKLSKKEEKALIKKIKAKIKDGEALDTDEEELAFEKDLL